MKKKLIKLHSILATQAGIDLLILKRSLRGLPQYLCDWMDFRRKYRGKMGVAPCLGDRFQEGGVTKSEYFWQDLLVARAIYLANPIRHVDIGSRVDGFVAHVASFRDCEVFDIRPITTKVPGVIFQQADLMDKSSLPIGDEQGYCDSLSCLHALEHFGLGRYGDTINPEGFQVGIENMVKLLAEGGTLYLSTPIGKERVEFNANWVFDPRTIVECARRAGVTLSKLIVITPDNGPQETPFHASALAELSLVNYQLGLFIFTKTLEVYK